MVFLLMIRRPPRATLTDTLLPYRRSTDLKVERVVRQSVKPVLVASRTFRKIARALIAFDGGPSSRKAVSFAATSPLFEDVELHLVVAGAETDKNRKALRGAREVLGDRCKRAEIVAEIGREHV